VIVRVNIGLARVQGPRLRRCHDRLVLIEFRMILPVHYQPASMPATLASSNTAEITAHSEPCTQLLDVPVALLLIILHHVPLQERLGVCTRVCRSFHAAAVAATTSISIRSIQERCDDVIHWLKRHGSGVTSLRAQYTHGFGPCLASLPCPQLRDLSLYGLSLQPGFFTACKGVKRLLLACCCMAGSPHATSSADVNPLMQLSVLTSLKYMCLASVRAGCSKPTGVVLGLPASLLSHLVQLTYLQLSSSLMGSDAPLQHMSALTALQELNLGLWSLWQQHSTAAALIGLQELQHLQHLTALKLDSAAWPIDLHSMPALTALTALRVLCLSNSTSVDPAVLAGFRQLQQLELACKDTWNAQGSAALLAAIGQQLQLTRLKLRPGSVWSTPSAAAFSALTASSHLQHLELLWCEFPVGAWQQSFPPNRSLPQLTHLWLDAGEREGGAQQLSPANVQAMVSCCPSLTFLRLGSQLAVSTAGPLSKLTGLAGLLLHASFQDNAPSLAQLTGLQRLVLNSNKPGEQVTVNGLLQLTVLQQLRDLDVRGALCEPGLATPAAAPHSATLSFVNWVRMSQQCSGLGRRLIAISQLNSKVL